METFSVEEQPPLHKVFINFRGADLRLKFVSHLVKDLKFNNINAFIDNDEDRGQRLDVLLNRIEESKIALVIFSEHYTESEWCLKELDKIKDCLDEGTLVAIPVFYKLEPSKVKYLEGKFGDRFRRLAKGDERKKKWKEAIQSIPNVMGITIDKKSIESEKVNEIVEAVKKVLNNNIPPEGGQMASVDSSGDSKAAAFSGGGKLKTFGNVQRLKELEEKLDRDKYKGTRIIGVVGMPGIGKTTLMKELYKTWQHKFTRHAFVDKIRVKSKDFGSDCLPTLLLGELSKLNNPHIDNLKDPFSQLHERKVLVILDDVSNQEQIDALRKILDWIKEGKEGSRVVIATSDMSLTNGLVDDTYMVQNLNHRDSLELFHYHAFNCDPANPPKDFMKLSEGFVHYARGHPLALKILGGELNKKSMDHWNSKLKKLAQSPSPNIGSVFQVSYDELTSEQKDAFLDIACFRSQDKDYVESLLASSDLGSAEAMSALKALTNKFLINTCDGRVEMHDLLYTFARELDPKGSTQDGIGSGNRRLWLPQDIIKRGVINVLQNKMKAANVRGIFLDLAEVKYEMSLDRDHFLNMGNLRYLKFYNSHCPQECKTTNKINIPDKLKLPLKEVRCLHWLKFPLEELPNDFNPINLVDLKLPHSHIKQLWEGDKDTPFLKWVDLKHSSKLCCLSGLSKAEKLQRLNLEGCTTLKTLPHDMEKMMMLSFLNLKGCTSLESLPEMNLNSMKTLTLSGCSKLKEFPMVSENLRNLYIDGTSISQFPANMEKLQSLVVLNMKDCKMLKEIPDRVGELKALQELILSDCVNLKDFPNIKMSSLNILLLDGTAIEVMPLLYSLQYLSLSRNAEISCLPAGISQCSQLKWMDLKYCTSLASVPEFPPNLQCLDAHGCSSLKTVSKPLARIIPTEQNHSTFIFTNCKNLEQAAKEEITSYAQRKCQLLSYTRKRYNGGLVSESLFSTCFPGCGIPSWFSHETVGSELEVKLLPHWDDKKLAGIVLCAVVSCLEYQDQICRLSVTCTFNVKDEDKSWVPFTCPVGSWTRNGDRKDKIEPEHVFIGYTSCPQTMKCPADGNSDKCNLSEASLKFTVSGDTNEKGKFKVLKCGLSLVYAKDKNENSSHEAKYDMPVGNRFPEASGVDGVKKTEVKNETPVEKNFQENSEEVDGRVKKMKAKSNMEVEKSFQETSEAVDGKVKKRKKTRRDDGRLKKKERSKRYDNQQGSFQDGKNSVVEHMVENLHGGGQSVLNEILHKTPCRDEGIQHE